jgi:hypothetical protein
MLALALALLVAQTPAPREDVQGRGLVVMVARNEGLTPIEAVTLADRLSKALQGAKVLVAMSPDEAISKLGPLRSPESCLGKLDCFAEMGRELGVAAVVTIDSSKVFDDLPMRLVLIDVQTEKALFRRSYTVSAMRPTELDSAFQNASQEIKKVTAELPGFQEAQAPAPVAVTPAPTDTPKAAPAPVLTPAPSEAPPLVVGEAARPSPVPVYLTRGGAAVTGAVAVALLVLGANQASQLQQERAPGISQWTYAEAQGLRSGANTRFVLSGILGGTAGALLVTSFLLPSEPAPAK